MKPSLQNVSASPPDPEGADALRVIPSAITYDPALPIVPARDEICTAIASHSVCVIAGETGSGKSTQLPKFLLDMGFGRRGRIGMTQPRRIAARAIAARLAFETGTELGRTVGVSTRFDDRVVPETAVKVMTDGILLNEIHSDRRLNAYDALVIDEAHERSLNIDFLLGYLKTLVARRRDLKVVVTSATIDPERFSRFFDDAPIVRVGGRGYPVEVRYRVPDPEPRIADATGSGRQDARKGRGGPAPARTPQSSERDINQEIAEGLQQLAREGRDRVLVFLPGEREIAEARDYLKGALRRETEILPLYSRLPRAAQDRVYSPARGPRVVLATNVAETSLTVPGINAVIDTGTARISRYSPRSKVQRLPVEAISQAAATQRSGRCGREGPGVALRLYEAEDFERRPEFTDPEILRTNLATVILKLKSLGIGELDSFPFLDAPPQRLVKDGYRLLEELGALNAQRRLTRSGRLLARLPIDPQLGRMLIEARSEGAVRELVILCAALSVQDPREWPPGEQEAAIEGYRPWADPRSDFLWFLNFWNQQIEERGSWGALKKTCLAHRISFLRVREWIDIHRQLTVQLHKEGFHENERPATYKAIHRCLISGLLSNVALRNERNDYVSARGTQFRLARTSVLAGKRVPWILVMQIVETRRHSARLAAKIDPAWAASAGAHVLTTDLGEVSWDAARGEALVRASRRLYQHTLVADLTLKLADFDPDTARDMLVREGLIEGKIPLRARPIRTFRAEFERVDYDEHKTRRRDLLLDENTLAEQLLELIPASVCDARALEEHLKSVPTLLAPVQARLRLRDDAGDRERFPDTLSVLGHDLPLHYAFEPGTEHDGITVKLPLYLLNAVDRLHFERLVPGYLGEKLETLLRSLPKRQRKALQPISAHVDALLAELPRRRGALDAALAEWVSARVNEVVGADLFNEAALPPHLRMRFELIGEDGAVLAAGRELDVLKGRFADSGRGAFTRAAGGETGGLDETPVTRYIWTSIPESVQLGADGEIRAWPAPTADGEQVSLRMYQTLEEAEAAFPLGVLQLARVALSRELKYARRQLPHADAIALGYMPFGDVGELKEALIQAVLASLMGVAGGPIRTREAFDAAVEATRRQFTATLANHAALLAEACTLSAELRRMLADVPVPDFVQEMQMHLSDLLGPGCLDRFGLVYLPELPRYLRGDITRVRGFAQDPGKDHKRSAQFSRHRARFERWSLQPGRTEAEIADARILLEEFRISLFAQALGTRRKVSPERLTAFFEGMPER